ncbi:MAG: hypothetical protein QNJ09_14330, partial [Paracoccaceae bacterium]|nr:hypothetical protein [Paracoccaceae bacterium]
TLNGTYADQSGFGESVLNGCVERPTKSWGCAKVSTQFAHAGKHRPRDSPDETSKYGSFRWLSGPRRSLTVQTMH